ncbi:hypothetical protein NDU88_004537 [Pleurodeles waltl]|uniref:Uncharacterized protein n=1 Tax=Pleurodeles waltl TaxID=8319 RepID=A0AAV7QFJ8_PLEWA|nr:hypothetical protein NDU88_004537 [Pleurodeles waltl]
MISDYFDFNRGSLNTHSMEWDAFKVTLRGHCLRLTWNVRLQLDKEVLHIDRWLRHLQSRVTHHPNSRPLLIEAQQEHSALLERLRCLDYMAQSAKTYDMADKVGSLLAWLIRQDHPYHPFAALWSTVGPLLYTPQEIHDEQVCHYTDLYHSVAATTCEDIDSFLSMTPLPRIMPDQQTEMDEPITLAEIQEAI